MNESNSNLILSYWRQGKHTQQIADLLNLREWQVYNFLAAARDGAEDKGTTEVAA